MKALFIVLLLFIVGGCNSSNINANTPVKQGWQAVYRHDENGSPIAGSMDALIDGIRSGYSVRVGWGWEKNVEGSLIRLEHMAEPLFLTIIQEEFVSAVIAPHPLLDSYIDRQTFGEGGHIWQCVLTSKGTFNAKVYNRASDELIRDLPQRQIMTWFLEYPAHFAGSPVKPLY
ncbi:hypothetical protein ACJJI4_12075 [Microbulbifer sp. TRSA002]|uniref:hypothetical protein n=1 Tax=Microbulbifer sp. TRSA002 TaxID=3243382 RepID=UPI00403920FB